MNKEPLRQKAVKSEGLSTRCSSCGFKNMMLGSDMKVSNICKVCSKSYREGYIKGYNAHKITINNYEYGKRNKIQSTNR